MHRSVTYINIINYSKTYRQKTEIIKIIQKNDGNIKDKENDISKEQY